ncbi:MAG: hypothetical protein QOI10_4267 [Solirubrobacterales bacterium]|nr:hypothetical protein [Solirubrobacterales bacterium]
MGQTSTGTGGSVFNRKRQIDPSDLARGPHSLAFEIPTITGRCAPAAARSESVGRGHRRGTAAAARGTKNGAAPPRSGVIGRRPMPRKDVSMPAGGLVASERPTVSRTLSTCHTLAWPIVLVVALAVSWWSLFELARLSVQQTERSGDVGSSVGRSPTRTSLLPRQRSIRFRSTDPINSRPGSLPGSPSRWQKTGHRAGDFCRFRPVRRVRARNARLRR